MSTATAHDAAGTQALLAASRALEDLRNPGTVLALRTDDGAWVYPVWQLSAVSALVVVGPGLFVHLRLRQSGSGRG